jgi:hypothetical protein
VAQRGQGDRFRVDGVGLPGLAHGTACAGHQLGGDSDDPAAGGEQIGLQTTGQMPAVFDGEAHLLELGGPADQLQVALAVRADGLHSQPTADIVDRDDGVGAFV